MYYGWIRKESMHAIVMGPQCRITCQEYHTDACRNTVSKPDAYIGAHTYVLAASQTYTTLGKGLPVR